MNKKGNIFTGITIALVVFVFGVLFLPFVTDDVVSVRTALDCTNSTGITAGTMVNCLMSDLVVPYLIWFMFSLALGFIAGAIT